MRAPWLALIVACNVPDRAVMPTAAPPRPVVGQADATAMAVLPTVWDRDVLVGRDQMCALRPDGHVMCWGANTYGEVGDVAGVPHQVPIVVPGVEHAVAISAGSAGTCAALADGHVQCWGSYETKLAVLRRIAGVDDAIEVAVSAAKSCARRRDGVVWCWSSNDPASPSAERVDELGVARRLVAGNDFACTVGIDGKVRCMSWWSGANKKPTFSELEITDAEGAIAIAAYFQSACAARRDGTVTCWSLQHDRGPPTLTVSKVIGLSDAVDVVAGLSETCAARRGGGVACFQSGARVDTDWKPRDDLRGFRALALATSANCGLRADHTIACWGDDYGPLGRYAMRGAQLTPVEIPNVTNATELALEVEQSCARTTTGGVTCWSTSRGPAQRIAIQRADHVVAGKYFSCAIVGGTPSCWGLRSWSPCRWESRDNCQSERYQTPTKLGSFLDVPHAVALVDPCVIDSAGHVHCVSVDTSRASTVEIPGLAGVTSASERCGVAGGQVSCWQIANTSATVTAVGGLASITQVVSGTAHDCALAKSGQVSCWGANRAGELGDGTRVTRTEPKSIATLEDVVELAAGDRFTCARTRSGSVWCWGANEAGAIGDGSGRDQKNPVRVPGLDDAVELRARGTHVCVRRANHHVACWGHGAETTSEDLPVARAVQVLEPDVLEP